MTLTPSNSLETFTSSMMFAAFFSIVVLPETALSALVSFLIISEFYASVISAAQNYFLLFFVRRDDRIAVSVDGDDAAVRSTLPIFARSRHGCLGRIYFVFAPIDGLVRSQRQIFLNPPISQFRGMQFFQVFDQRILHGVSRYVARKGAGTKIKSSEAWRSRGISRGSCFY